MCASFFVARCPISFSNTTIDQCHHWEQAKPRQDEGKGQFKKAPVSQTIATSVTLFVAVCIQLPPM